MEWPALASTFESIQDLVWIAGKYLLNTNIFFASLSRTHDSSVPILHILIVFSSSSLRVKFRGLRARDKIKLPEY